MPVAAAAATSALRCHAHGQDYTCAWSWVHGDMLTSVCVCVCMIGYGGYLIGVITPSLANETLELDVRALTKSMCHVWRADLDSADCGLQLVSSGVDSVCACRHTHTERPSCVVNGGEVIPRAPMAPRATTTPLLQPPCIRHGANVDVKHQPTYR